MIYLDPDVAGVVMDDAAEGGVEGGVEEDAEEGETGTVGTLRALTFWPGDNT
jgi:hypothetical protein